MNLKLRRLDIGEFKDIHSQYLVNDFPLLERKPFYFLYRMYEEGKYSCYILENKGKIKGYASFVWKNEDVVLLDYFATISGDRGTGIGSKMINMLMKELGDKTIIFECESPETARDPEERDLRERRIKFYRKNGAIVSDVETKMAGVNYKIMYLAKKEKKRNIKDEISLIYKNMFPKFIFRKIVKVM